MITSAASEKHLLGIIIEHGSGALLTALERGISPSVIADPILARIFGEILRRHSQQLPFGVEFLWQSMSPTPEEADALLAATRTETCILNLGAICEEVRGAAYRRKVLGLASRLTEAATDAPDAINDIVAEVISASAETSTSRTWEQICAAADERAIALIEGRQDPAEFISWGFPSLDAAFKPLGKGELVTVGARPSLGKSSLGRAIADSAALAGRHVLFESLEVTADKVLDGMATGLSGVATADLSSAPSQDQQRFRTAIAKLRRTHLHVCEDRTLAAIIGRAKAMHSQRPLDLLVVDYLGQIDDCRAKKGETVAQAVGNVTKALKRLALEMRITVLCLAQLNRGSVNDGNREPRLSDLRDSGDVEQDSDRVVLLHRPDLCPITQRDQSGAKDAADLPRYGVCLIQAKGRDCGTGYGAAWFNRRLARFEF